MQRYRPLDGGSEHRHPREGDFAARGPPLRSRVVGAATFQFQRRRRAERWPERRRRPTREAEGIEIDRQRCAGQEEPLGERDPEPVGPDPNVHDPAVRERNAPGDREVTSREGRQRRLARPTPSAAERVVAEVELAKHEVRERRLRNPHVHPPEVKAALAAHRDDGVAGQPAPAQGDADLRDELRGPPFARVNVIVPFPLKGSPRNRPAGSRLIGAPRFHAKAALRICTSPKRHRTRPVDLIIPRFSSTTTEPRPARVIPFSLTGVRASQTDPERFQHPTAVTAPT